MFYFPSSKKCSHCDNKTNKTNNLNVKCNQEGSQLTIKDKTKNWFSKGNDASQIILYMPENMLWDSVKIDAGAGKINIEELNTKELVLNLGAGNTEISRVNVSEKCSIDGGVGKLSILSGTINNLDLDMGIGQTDLVSKITGKSDINSGIGKVSIRLLGDKDNYKFKINKGIGVIDIAGEKMKDGQEWGNGKNYIDIDGGIGEIKIDF